MFGSTRRAAVASLKIATPFAAVATGGGNGYLGALSSLVPSGRFGRRPFPKTQEIRRG
jgi:hypothetical protein